MVLIGKKRERVAVQRSSGASPDPYGDIGNQSWSTLGTYWAEVEPISGREYFAQDRTKEVISHRFWFRHNSVLAGLSGADRLVWNSQNFDVVEVINKGARDKEIQVMTRLHQ